MTDETTGPAEEFDAAKSELCDGQAEPWFAKPVFDAFVTVISTTSARVYSDPVLRKVRYLLENDLEFLENARREIIENSKRPLTLPAVADARPITRSAWVHDYVNKYRSHFARDENFKHSPHSGQRLNEIERQKFRKLYTYHGDNRVYEYPEDPGSEPWFLESVFKAFAAAIEEKPGHYRTYGEGRDRAIRILQDDKDFVEKAKKFYADNDWIFREWEIGRLVDTYVYNRGSEAAHHHGPFGTANLSQLVSRLQSKPYTPEEAALVYWHLHLVMQKGRFQTPHAADGAVAISIRDAGIPDFPAAKVRKIITLEARSDYARFQELVRNAKPDAYDADENAGKIETSFTRAPGRPTGSFGSTQSARRFGR